MDAALNRKSLALGVPGIALQLVGQLLPMIMAAGGPPRKASAGPPPVDPAIVLGGLAMVLVGTVLLIAGLAMYARAKHQSGWWGLLGFLSCIGLIVLAVLPDREKQARAAAA